MPQVSINQIGDLIFSFSDKNYSNTMVYQLDNGAELEFYNNECVALILPSFVQKLNRGPISDVKLESFDLIDNTAHFNIDIGGQVVNGRVSFESLKS